MDLRMLVPLPTGLFLVNMWKGEEGEEEHKASNARPKTLLAYNDEIGRVEIAIGVRPRLKNEAGAVVECQGVGGVDQEPHQAHAHARHEASLHARSPGVHEVGVVPVEHETNGERDFYAVEEIRTTKTYILKYM